MSSTDKQEKKPLTLTLKPVEVKTLTPAQNETAKSKLIVHAKQLNQTYNERKDEMNAEREARRKEHEQRVEQNRQKGSDALFAHLKSLIPEKIKTYAGYGKTEARIFEFTFGEEVKFENCYAKDLLSKGNIIKDLQAWLDEEHADVEADGTKRRAFLIYFNMVGRQQYDRAANKFAVFVNWDESAWPAIIEKVERGSQVRSRAEGNDGSAPRRRDNGRYGDRRNVNRNNGYGANTRVQTNNNADSENTVPAEIPVAQMDDGFERPKDRRHNPRSVRPGYKSRNDNNSGRTGDNRTRQSNWKPRPAHNNNSIPAVHNETITE